MHHWIMLIRMVGIGLLFSVWLTQTSTSAAQSPAYAQGKWTRLLDGTWWHVQGVSGDPVTVYLLRSAERPPDAPGLRFQDPIGCTTEFTPLEAKVLHRPTMTLREGEVRYREFSRQRESFRFSLIEPGAGIYIYDGWQRDTLSPDRQRFVYLHGLNMSFYLLADFSWRGGLYENIDPAFFIRPGPERGDSRMAFEAYRSLLVNEGLGPEEDEWQGPWPYWLIGVVGWTSTTEFLYLANRTTDLKSAWLNKDEKWLEKIRWSLWRVKMKVEDRSDEQLVWDSQALGEPVLQVLIIPQLRLLVETQAHLLVIDREGRTRLTVSKDDWEFPDVDLDHQQSLWGGMDFVIVSPDGTAFLLKKRGTQELWVVKSDGGQPIQLPAVPAPFPRERRVYISFAPDGSRLAYFALVEAELALVVMEVSDPPSLKLYRLDDPGEVLEPRRSLSWVDRETLIVPVMKREAQEQRVVGKAYVEAQRTWLLRLAEEGRP